MDLGAILLLLGLVVLVGVYVGKPLFQPASGKKSKNNMLQNEKELRISTLKAERDRLVTALQELDFDQSLGKVPDEEYQYQRAQLVQRGIAVLRELDTIQKFDYDGLAVDRLEEAITKRKKEKFQDQSSTHEIEIELSSPEKLGQKQTGSSIEHPEDDIENLIASRKRNRSEKTAGFCPRCGHPAQKSDRFCSKCGSPLT